MATYNNSNNSKEYHIVLTYTKNLSTTSHINDDDADLEYRLHDVVERCLNSDDFETAVNSSVESLSLLTTTSTEDILNIHIQITFTEDVDKYILEDFIQDHLYTIIEEDEETITWEEKYEDAVKEYDEDEYLQHLLYLTEQVIDLI